MALTKVPSNLDSITATTQSQGDGSTNVATTAYVDTGLNALIDSAPGNLNTLNELAAAMNDNASFFSTVLPLSGGTMTGNIAHASDFTLDVAGDIILDADGGDIRFKDAGTEIGVIENSSSDLQIKASVQDKDIIFRGNDGGSGINALRLDMSQAGAATFNGVVTADAGVKIDNITIDGTTASLSGSSDFTIDVGGRIDLSADDNGEIRLYDGSSLYAQFKDDDDRLRIQTMIQDKDMLFVGNDGGSEVTALSFDMSEAGAAIFNAGATFGGNITVSDGSPEVTFQTGASHYNWQIAAQENTNSAFEIAVGSQDADASNDTFSPLITIDSAGQLLIGTTSLPSAGSGGTGFRADSNGRRNLYLSTTATNNQGHITFLNPNGEVGSITTNGSGTTYNTSSDIRLKTNIEPINNSTEKIMAMNPVKHKWKADQDADAVHGFIAQEMMEIMPEAVSGDPEGEEMMSMDYGRITPVLVAALQEANKKITDLENRIQEMESK